MQVWSGSPAPASNLLSSKEEPLSASGDLRKGTRRGEVSPVCP